MRLSALVVLLSALCVSANNNGNKKQQPAARARAQEPPTNYMQQHMASEHHIGAFDLASFFQLHDLDRNGVLDRAEIEAI